MKISKLLVLSALWLGITSSANAAELTKVWTVAEPQGLEFTDATFDDFTRYYLYNPGAKMFFASGNDWNTRASIATFGYEVWFTSNEQTGTTGRVAPEGSYFFNDNVQHPDRVLGDKDLFTDDGGSTWCDRAPDNAGQTWFYYTVTKVGDSYRIQNSAMIAEKPEFEGKFFGWKGGYDDTRLYMIAPEEGAVDWKFVTSDSYLAFVESEGYAEYQSSVATYQAALDLKTAIEAAEQVYVDVAAAVAIYNNDESTAEQMKTATTALKELTEVKGRLKAAIEEAEAQGFTATADYRAVLENLSATKEEVEQAIADLSAALVEWGKTNATWEKPVDMSGMIVNPNFDNASSSGWSGTSPNMVGSGSHGPANVAETWNATFDMYQDIEELPTGVYSLGAKTSWRGSWNDMKNGIVPAAKLYVKVGDLESSVPFNYIWGCFNTQALGGATYFGTSAGENSQLDEESGNTYYSPNDPSAFRLYEEAGFYDTKVMFAVSEGKARIGVKNPALKGDADNWSCYDTFTLTYYGNGADACQPYLDEAIQTFQPYEVEEGVVYTESYLTAYNEMLGQTYTASSMDEVSEILGSISGAYNALQKNIQLWKDLAKAVEDAKNLPYIDKIDQLDMDEAYDLLDFLYSKGYEDIRDEASLTNEELEAQIAELKRWLDVVAENASGLFNEGDDVTSLLTNPAFEFGLSAGAAEGWTVDRIEGGNVTPGPIGDAGDTFREKVGYYNACFESWHCHKWDVWQEIKNAPVGVYEIQVQGYVRCEVSGYNRGDDLIDPYTSPVYLYLNNALSQFPSVYSQVPADHGIDFQIIESWTTEEINGNLYPNSMGGAAQCFSTDMYQTTAYGIIKKNGDPFRIGVKMDADQDWWCIWDNFKLTYQGFSADKVLPALEEALAMINISQPMGKEWFTQAESAVNAANEAIASGDGRTMFNVLSDIYDISEGIRASIALFAKLKNTNDELGAAIWQTDNTEAQAAANTLFETIQNGIENHEFADADVEGLLDQIQKMMTKLAIPANWKDATDDAPADFTNVIVNAGYDEGLSGWSGTGAAWSDSGWNAEIFGKDYDYYQDIAGLPEGTYQVGVQAFYRAGGATADYEAYVANPDSLNHAFIYAMNGDSIVSSVPMKRLASEANVGDSYDGYVQVKASSEEGAGDGLYVCNNMTAAGDEFAAEKYINEGPIVKVLADGKLRIGLKKTTNITDNWTLFDNWTLKYFGSASAKTPSDDPSGIKNAENAPVVRVEFFTLDGRKANTVAKGIMIVKETLANGNVIVKKIQK